MTTFTIIYFSIVVLFSVIYILTAKDEMTASQITPEVTSFIFLAIVFYGVLRLGKYLFEIGICQ